MSNFTYTDGKGETRDIFTDESAVCPKPATADETRAALRKWEEQSAMDYRFALLCEVRQKEITEANIEKYAKRIVQAIPDAIRANYSSDVFQAAFEFVDKYYEEEE